MDPILTAFGLTLLAGMATGVGSAIAFAASQTNYRFLSLDELLPTIRAYGKGHDSLLGLVAGMMVMARAFC